jgi:DNA (cytosine-5)-methyltransferase 1
MLKSIELCAGAGGQALGLELAGFHHSALVEIEPNCCKTLRLNRPEWNVIEGDLKTFEATRFQQESIDLLAAGLPCPPFSVAGKQLGADDERNLFPDALRIISECRPKAVMIENVRGFLDASFAGFRSQLKADFDELGYEMFDPKLLNASDFGVPQLRPRVVIVAMKREFAPRFDWSNVTPSDDRKNVGDTLYDLMAANGWQGAKAWRNAAKEIGPTIVGGSHKHGGPDLGPTRARAAWEKLGVNGKTIAEEAPDADFQGLPRLTIRMVARIQGFPDAWQFFGRKTAAYRQVGNAFPPPVAAAVAEQIALTLKLATPVRAAAE